MTGISPHTLGYQATVQVLFHRLFQGSGTMVMVLAVEGPRLEPAWVVGALRSLQAKQPLLQAGLVELAGSPCFTFGSAPPWVEVGSGLWTARELAEAELARGLDPAVGLWRVTVAADARPQLLALTIHHAVADAGAGVWLLRELLARVELAEPVPGVAVAGPVYSNVRAAQPELALRTRVHGEETLALEDRWPRCATAPLATRVDRLLELGWPADLGPRLRAACRREATTLQGAMLAALFRAAADVLGATGLLPLTSAVDLRRRLAERACQPLGCEITMLTTFHASQPRLPFWEEARQGRAQLRELIVHRRATGFHPRFKANLLASLMRNHLGQAEVEGIFPAGPALSNLGVAELGGRLGSYAIRELRFTSIQKAGLYLCFCTLATLEEVTGGWFGYTEPLLAPAAAAAIVARLRAALEAALA